MVGYCDATIWAITVLSDDKFRGFDKPEIADTV